MGQEISESRFGHEEFRRFQSGLREETRLLVDWMASNHFSDRDICAGLELELCLVDGDGLPSASNQQVIEAVKCPDVVPELSQFNLEFNVQPASPRGQGLLLLAERLDVLWKACQKKSNSLGLSVVSIGILPTLTDEHLVLENMTRLHRYHALNEQVLRLRQGKPVRLDIHGIEDLMSSHLDVMLEAAATSFQLHLQIPQCQAVNAYNLSVVLSAPMVALAANSPLLFGKRLWQESRIPLFEQAVAVEGPVSRVNFGTGYAQQDIASIFVENERLFPILLPLEHDTPREKLGHVRLHNGTIWRWNRPIIGFDPDGQPHLRIEHRVMAAGTSSLDMVCQMAFYYGLMVAYLEQDDWQFEEQLPFLSAWSNFYDAARNGLKSHIQWIDGKKWPISKLILDVLIPTAAQGCDLLEIDSSIHGRWLSVLAGRVESGQTGAQWQLNFFEKSGRNTATLVREYRDRQASGQPVHEWEL